MDNEADIGGGLASSVPQRFPSPMRVTPEEPNVRGSPDGLDGFSSTLSRFAAEQEGSATYKSNDSAALEEPNSRSWTRLKSNESSPSSWMSKSDTVSLAYQTRYLTQQMAKIHPYHRKVWYRQDYAGLYSPTGLTTDGILMRMYKTTLFPLLSPRAPPSIPRPAPTPPTVPSSRHHHWFRSSLHRSPLRPSPSNANLLTQAVLVASLKQVAPEYRKASVLDLALSQSEPHRRKFILRTNPSSFPSNKQKP